MTHNDDYKYLITPDSCETYVGWRLCIFCIIASIIGALEFIGG